jgi:hypothetical protein
MVISMPAGEAHGAPPEGRRTIKAADCKEKAERDIHANVDHRNLRRGSRNMRAGGGPRPALKGAQVRGPVKTP